MAFRYDYTKSYESNFQDWWRLNNYEKKDYQLESRLRWTQDMARQIYDKHYGHKKIKIKRIKLY
jgi:hypothetical protein